MNDKLTEISDVMKRESPVLIVGAPRSGTSLLYLMLQRHSSFSAHNCENESKADLTESNIFRLPYDTYSNPNSTAFAYMLRNQACYEQFVSVIHPIVRQQQFLLGKKHFYKIIPKLPFLQESTRVSLWKVLGNDRLIRAFFYYAKLARGMHRIIEKTPQHISLLPEIKETFPQAQLIFIARHPIDVFSSYQRRLHDSLTLGAKKKQLAWLDISPNVFCKKYANYMNIVLQELAANPHRFLLIKYEDFVKDAYHAMEQILNFLEEPCETVYIPETTAEKTKWQDDPNLFGDIKLMTKKWQSYVDKTQAALIEDRLMHIISQFGYSRYT